jgi:hypothetical protein
LTHRTAYSSGTGKNPEKTLVESVSAIFDTLRQGIPKVFPVFSPVLHTRWGGSSLAFVEGKRFVKGDKIVGQV